MLNTLSDLDLSSDFVCPCCGVSAFEVLAESPEENGRTDGSITLSTMCFGCRQVFQRRLDDSLIAMVDTAN